MTEQSLSDIDRGVFDALKAPPLIFYLVLAILGTGIFAFFLCWLYQLKTGMGVAGISHPTGWGVYIVNFVYWVGIAHSGTLISAILYLVRARYRDAVSRSAEAMTIFAIAIAGLFPLIHLGRFWVFYYLLPYPSQRQIWPNFISALLWDVVAVSTYFVVSLIFFYVGLIPDLAAAREFFNKHRGNSHPRTRLYKALSLGWYGSSSQWLHYNRGYLFFAALATPLVISVHSIVSWDFAMSLLPGWHTTLFAPYFVAGAIHSGLAMVMVLLIPMRRMLNFQSFIGINHFEKIAQTMLVTTAIVGYSYIILPFFSWYSGNIFDWQLEKWHMTDSWAWAYWGIILLNVLVPSSFAFRKIRRNLKCLFTAGILVVIGMWIERFLLVPSPLSHDFLPHNWGNYTPTWIEMVITFGSFCIFFFLFLSFSKALPAIPLSDVKTGTANHQTHESKFELHEFKVEPVKDSDFFIIAVFKDVDGLLAAIDKLTTVGKKNIEVYTPQRIAHLMQILGHTRSPVALWTLVGALLGMICGYALPIFTALRNHLIVGAKHPVSIIPYSIIAFELIVLFGSIANFIALARFANLGNRDTPLGFDPSFTLDRMGVVVSCAENKADNLRTFFENNGACEVKSSGRKESHR